MPNRIIKESICTSEKLSKLTDFEFRLWVGLITQADDAGRGDARSAIIKGRVFPLRERVTVKDVDEALHGLAAKSCVSFYIVDRKPYYWFPTWTEHQRIRDCKPKYPGPEEQDFVNSPQVAASCRKSPPESNPIRIQSESESESEGYSPEQTGAAGFSEPPVASEKQEPVITMTLNDKTEFPIYKEQADEWAGLYPAVDVIQQLRAMKGWLDANPKQRKTSMGILRFVNGWLSKEQDRGGSAKHAPRSPGKLRDTQTPPSYDIDKFMEWNFEEMYGPVGQDGVRHKEPNEGEGEG